MKTIFLGTPEFSIPSLEELLRTNWIQLLAVCTQTDKQAGRGQKITEPPVKKLAKEKGILVLQCEKIAKEKEVIEKIKELKPDILISCAFGQILSKEILDIAPYGVINVHGSLLPKYRGAAPVNWAILNGEAETGISVMKTDIGLDTGPVILQEVCEMGKNETSIELIKKLSFLGAKALLKTLELIKDGKAKPTLQDNSKATKAPVLKKELGLIDWNKSREEIHNKIRGLQPWPSAFTHFRGGMVKIWESRLSEMAMGRWGDGASGTIVEIGEYIKVKTQDGLIDIYKLQPENKNIIKVKDWVNGARVSIGDCFG